MLHNFVPFYTCSALRQVGALLEREWTDNPPADAFEKYNNVRGGSQSTGKKALPISVLTNGLLLAKYFNSVRAGKYFNAMSFLLWKISVSCEQAK